MYQRSLANVIEGGLHKDIRDNINVLLIQILDVTVIAVLPTDRARGPLHLLY